MNASNATTINTNVMGIADFQKALSQGVMTVKDVLDILEARIAKRVASGKTLIPGVIRYRNELAETFSKATGTNVAPIPVPTYASPNPALPTDPEQLADVVFATVGAARVGDVISRLTQRVCAAA